MLNATLVLKTAEFQVANYSFHKAIGHFALLEWVMMSCTSADSDLSKKIFFFFWTEEKNRHPVKR